MGWRLFWVHHTHCHTSFLRTSFLALKLLPHSRPLLLLWPRSIHENGLEWQPSATSLKDTSWIPPCWGSFLFILKTHSIFYVTIRSRILKTLAPKILVPRWFNQHSSRCCGDGTLQIEVGYGSVDLSTDRLFWIIRVGSCNYTSPSKHRGRQNSHSGDMLEREERRNEAKVGVGEIGRVRRTWPVIAASEDGGRGPEAKERGLSLEAGKGPQPTANKEMATSVLQPHELTSANNLNELK